MVGLFTALGRVAGRVGTEAIDRKKEEVKAKREMQLQKLQQEFLGGQNAMQIASNEKLAGAQLAATKENTAAQLGVQERIATAGNRSSETIAKGGQETTEKVAKLSSDTTKEGYRSTSENIDKQLAAQRDIAMAGIESDEKRTTQQIAANKELAEIQQAGAWKPTLVMNADGKTSRTVLMNDAGKYNELPIDANTGKPLNPVLTDTDTEPARNYKFLISQGVPEAEAVERAFAKGDNKDALALGYFDSLSKAASAGIKPLSPDEQTELHRLADLMAGKIPAADATTTAPAAGTDAGTAPTSAATPAAAATLPPGVLPMPRTQGELKTNMVYPLPDGRFGRWNGTNFIVVPAPAPAPAAGSPISG